MSPSRRELLLGSAAAVAGAALGARWARTALQSEPVIAHRDRPLLLRTGRLQERIPLTQRLRVPALRLRRVDFALATEADESHAELFLRFPGRLEGPFFGNPGPWLHRGIRALRFDLPDLEVPAGDLELGLLGTSASTYLIARGVTGRPNDYGRDRLTGKLHQRIIACSRERFSGLAILTELPRNPGPVHLDLYELPESLAEPYARQPIWPEDLDVSSATPIRSVELSASPPTLGGHLPLRFAPLEDTFGRSFAARLRIPPTAALAGAYDGFGYVPLFGDYGPREPFLGASLDGRELPGCDLAVSIWASA